MEFIKEITTNRAGRQQPSAEGCISNLPAPGSVHSLDNRAVRRCARCTCSGVEASDLFMESPAVFTHNPDPPTVLSFLGELGDVVERAEGIPAGVVVGHTWNPVSAQPTSPAGFMAALESSAVVRPEIAAVVLKRLIDSNGSHQEMQHYAILIIKTTSYRSCTISSSSERRSYVVFDSPGGASSDGVGASAAPSLINCQGRSVGGVPMSDRQDATLRTLKVFEENKDRPLSATPGNAASD